MELGNLLAPLIVLAVTLTLVRGLFARLEHSQRALEMERASKAALEERERLASQLHDGISQSLILLAVKLDQFEAIAPEGPVRQLGVGLRDTIRVINEDVRQAISNLKLPPSPEHPVWVMPLRELLRETANVTDAEAEFAWDIPEGSLSAKDKGELHACTREALINVQKHSNAKKVFVIGESDGGGFRCAFKDIGVGFKEDPMMARGRFGLRMVRDRANRMGWIFIAERRGDRTLSNGLKKGGKTGDGSNKDFAGGRPSSCSGRNAYNIIVKPGSSYRWGSLKWRRSSIVSRSVFCGTHSYGH